MKPARVEIAAPGGKPTYVVRAPFAVEPESKRGPKIEKQEKVLEEELLSLERGTKLRNREFYTHLDGIEEHGHKWEVKLREEEKEQREMHTQLVTMFEEMLDATIFAEKKALVSDFERFHTEKIPPQEVRMGESEHGLEVFVGETIPAVVDRQSGIVSRQLQRAHNTFDIENAKVMKREQKIVSRFQKHAERTAQSFEDERATRRSKFMLLEEDMADTERVYDRAEEKSVRDVVNEIVSIRDLLREENTIREKEDNTLLDTMLYAQQRLQAAIVRSFGADADRQSAGLLLGHETDPAAAGAGAGGGPYDATGDRAF